MSGFQAVFEKRSGGWTRDDSVPRKTLSEAQADAENYLKLGHENFDVICVTCERSAMDCLNNPQSHRRWPECKA